ncbi:MAG: argininosuccinate lyase [Spirochaetaceae bacterium]|jgi:argininosuccinate lyase|nr:argininosuccinate lyase [Spirochaetaceae bacterium]
MAEKTEAVLWAGRLAEKPEAEAFAFQSSIRVDRRLALDDIRGSRAHAAMLGKQGIITGEHAAALDAELAKIARGIETGAIAVDEGAEDIHSYVEGLLTATLGDAGRAVHAGRSRNDQVATDFRLYCKRAGADIRDALKSSIDMLLDRAEEHAASLMAGFTHLQRAQPVTLGHELVAWAAALSRDAGRFSDALMRLDECPLGSGALAATTLPLDREMTARELGFARPALNSMDAVADRDFALELAAACAITQTHLSRFCEEVCLWASEEWGFVDLGEKWSTGSSIMPQKKNPDFAELIRGKTGRVNGNLVALLTVMKGLPYAYNKDLQEDKEALFDSFDTVLMNLRMFAGFMGAAVFNTRKMEASCSGGFSEATDVAEYLVKKGLPFRKAHECAALIVRECIDAGLKRIGDMPLSQLQNYSALFEADIFEKITPRACVEARNIPGGPAPDEVRRQIAVLRESLSAPEEERTR